MTNDPSKADHAAPQRSLWSRFRSSKLWDPATRAAHSAWQATVAVWFVGGVIPAAGLGSVPWFAGLIAGATAAVGSAAASAITWKVPPQTRPVDTVIRLARTFAVTLAGTWVASAATVLTFDWRGAALTAALTAASSLIKTVIVNGGTLGNELVDQQIAIRRDPDGYAAAVKATLAQHGVEPLD